MRKAKKAFAPRHVPWETNAKKMEEKKTNTPPEDGVGVTTSNVTPATMSECPTNQQSNSSENKIPAGTTLLLDRVFKYVYTRDDDRSRANLRQLTSILLGRNVTWAEARNPEVYASAVPSTEKASRYDIRVRLENGEQMDVEVQLYKEKDDYAKRLTYYGAKLYASQKLAGEKYATLKNCYQVMISDVTIFPNTDWLLNFDISAQENRMVKFEGLRWIVIQLSYLEKALKEGVGRGNKYLQNLLELCKFFKKPENTEPFNDVYEDCVKYWTEDEIEAYNQEIAERMRLDRASSKAYMEDLIQEQAATIAANMVEIEASKAEIEASKAEIEASKAEIEASKAEIEASKAEIEASKAEIEASKAIIADMANRMRQLEALLAAKV